MNKMILVDLETQSFEVESGIFEVACLVIDNYQIVDQLYLGKEIKGYTGERKYGYGFYDISSDAGYIDKFKTFIDKYQYPLVAHNCPFDRKFLVYYKWIDEEYPAYCSMRAIRMADDSLSSYSLHNLINHYKVASEVDHTAMSDIKNLYHILNIVKPQIWLQVGSKAPAGRFAHTTQKARTLEEIDLNIETTQILSGEYICFTGESMYPRNTMQEIAIKNGAKISGSITLKTTLLVVGMNAGSKLDKAQERGISIISDDDFMHLVNLHDIQIHKTM